MIVIRVEKHRVSKSNEYYCLLDDFCFRSKNLYNHANYVIRNEFCKSKKWIRCDELDKLLKSDLDYPDYRNMPTAQSAQQILRLLDKNWKAFFASIKDWKTHKEKYSGQPKLPKYKNKNGKSILILTNQNVKLCNGYLKFPKVFNGFSIKPRFITLHNFVSLQQVRFIPKINHIVVEIVYCIEIPDIKIDTNNYISIDIGVDNLTTITNNFGEVPFIINGKGLKSKNKYYNKLVSKYKSISTTVNNQKTTHRIQRITEKRNYVIDNYLHAASRIIINYAKDHNVSVIVIGNNKEWKQNSKLSKKVNQTFCQIPFSRLIEMIIYKAQELGISVKVIEESYTSGTSFLDNELPIKENYNKSRRIYRGLFKSNSGVLINSDVNGSFQIMKKVFPNAYANGIEDVALHPVVVNACNI